MRYALYGDRQSTWRIQMVTCLMAVLTACGSRPAPLTQQEKQTVSEITTHLGPRCVGRYLIDMPRDALSFGTAKVQGVPLEAQAMTHDECEREVSQREPN